jgi:hypothetical protein
MLVKKKAYCLEELQGSLPESIGNCGKHFTTLVIDRIFLNQDSRKISDRERITECGIPISFDTGCIKFETVIPLKDIITNNFDKIQPWNKKCEQEAEENNYDAYCDCENHMLNVLDDWKENPDHSLYFKIISLGGKDYYFYTV